MQKVLVYKTDLLPRSETFIKAQVLAYRTWEGVLVGHIRAPDGLFLDELNVLLLLNDPPGPVEYLAWRLRRWIGRTSQSEIRRLARERPQLFHAHFGTVAVDIWPLVRALGLPMIVTLHGFDINICRDWWEKGEGGRRRRTYPKQLLRLAQEPCVRFVAVSDALRRRAIEFGIPARSINVCYIGVDTEKFLPGGIPISERMHRILFVGRLVEKKGVSHLIRAFAKVREIIPDVDLVIAGEGPLRSELTRLAMNLRVPVQFLGAVSPEEVKNQMELASVFCLPSVVSSNGDAEGFGIVLLEAQACGLPVVTSARGGAEEGMIDEVTGFSVSVGNEGRLAERLLELLSNRGRLHEMSLAAVEHVRARFDIRETTKALEAVYDELRSQEPLQRSALPRYKR